MHSRSMFGPAGCITSLHGTELSLLSCHQDFCLPENRSSPCVLHFCIRPCRQVDFSMFQTAVRTFVSEPCQLKSQAHPPPFTELDWEDLSRVILMPAINQPSSDWKRCTSTSQRLKHRLTRST
jgi:hypothetical protein